MNNDNKNCPPPIINVSPAEKPQIDNNMSDKDWSYYDENKDFLLRLALIDKKDIIIRIEVMITKTISYNNEMYSYLFKGKDIIEDLDYEENLDAFTILTLLFQDNAQLGEKSKKNVGEFTLKITKKNKICTLILKKQTCYDNNFIYKNIKKKIEQIKQEIKEKYNDHYTQVIAVLVAKSCPTLLQPHGL